MIPRNSAAAFSDDSGASTLSATAAARGAREFKEEASSANSARSLESAERYVDAWYRLRYRKAKPPRPIPAPVVVQFILDHAQRKSRTNGTKLIDEMPTSVERALVKLGVKKEAKLSLATIEHRVSMIGKINAPYLKQGAANPVAATVVRELLKNVRRSYGKRDAADPNPRPALTTEPLTQLIRALDDDLCAPKDPARYRRALRDRAMLLFAVASGGRRRSEVSNAVLERLSKKRNGDYIYRLGATKTDPGDSPELQKKKAVTGPAAAALAEWLGEARLGTKGPIFRRISSAGNISDDALTPATVRNVVVRLAAKAGLGASGFSAHSLRAGFVTEALNQGASVLETMKLAGHKHAQSTARYYRLEDPRDSPASSILQGIRHFETKRLPRK